MYNLTNGAVPYSYTSSAQTPSIHRDTKNPPAVQTDKILFYYSQHACGVACLLVPAVLLFARLHVIAERGRVSVDSVVSLSRDVLVDRDRNSVFHRCGPVLRRSGGRAFGPVAGRHRTAVVRAERGARHGRGHVRRPSEHLDRGEDVHLGDCVAHQAPGFARDRRDGRNHRQAGGSRFVDLRGTPGTGRNIGGRTRVGRSEVHDPHPVHGRCQGRRHGFFQERLRERFGR